MERRDAVSQNALAVHSGLTRGHISDLMPGLENKQLVSRGPSAFGPALRLFPTQEAERLLLLLYPRLEALSGQLNGRGTAP